MAPYEFILVEILERVGVVRINRPKALNALNHALMVELMDALAALDADTHVGAMLITGDERAFAVSRKWPTPARCKCSSVTRSPLTTGL
jgi:enoyl-CoA hydratase/carnithine racemase